MKSTHRLTGSALVVLLAGCAGSHASTGSGTLPALTSNAVARSSTGSEQILYSFTGGNDGGNAATGIAVDRTGNLYGTTVVGGTYTCGTVFKLAPQGSPPWSETVLYNFTCYGDGKSPHGGVTIDGHSQLYGTTVAGGSGYCTGDGCGVAYRLSGQHESVMHDFGTGSDGFGPGGPIAFDSAGHAYGTTPDGGSYSQGIVYELSLSGRVWHEKILHAFTGGADGGVGSLGPLLLDKGGNVYGVTEEGGAHEAGTVFELSRRSKKSWKLTTLYAFKGTPDAASPYGGLISDASGDLFGTTYYGGAYQYGTVFELVRKPKNKYVERVLYSFKGGNDGSSSTSTLLFGASNDLLGTTSAGGGTCDCGTIFEVNGKTGKEQVLHSFGNGADGQYPYYGLASDGSGNLYGTTVAGGAHGQGAVFEFRP
ncbi:MAG TPA: choice-of-anchor tandem repeat GloVer-containing protein [Candidatus Cybelea sp.]|nr:choice-of-anchor tandem repeat GloVer-containing protein [Candidatus Cybelea sp.]